MFIAFTNHDYYKQFMNLTNVLRFRYELMEKCWIRHPDERPGFDEVTLALRDIVERNGFSRKGALESSYVESGDLT